MITLFKKYYFKLQIKMLIFFRPSMLFERINQLGWYKQTLQQWIDYQSFDLNSKVLEVGCATGSLTNYIAKLGHISSGVDSSSKMIEMARLKNNNINFKTGNALDLPYQNESFDAVIAASLINIVSDKDKAVLELARVCRKGGVVTILVPAANFTNENLSSLQKAQGGSGFSAAAMEAWHKMPPKMNASDIQALFTKTGLTETFIQFYLEGMVISISGKKM